MTNKNLPSDAVTAITDAWYNQLSASLQLSVKNFQLLQPAAIPNDDESLWAYFNSVPPATLKYNYWYYNQPTFFDQYAAIVNQLTFPDSAFKKDIGDDNYTNWNDYLDSLPVPPPANTLPLIWFQWAMINAPSVANIGRSDLSQQFLFTCGQAALLPYQGTDAKPADFAPSFANLVATLQVSSSASFSFNSANDNPDVSNSWVPGYDPNFFGLWTGSWSGFGISKKFALSKISISIQFDHFAVLPITLGPWYNSSLLHVALVSDSTPPWANAADWNKYFGKHGTFNYANGSVIAADGISLTLTADAAFTDEELSVIEAQIGMGYWPIYGMQQSSAITNTVTAEPGKLTIQMQSAPGNPVLLGMNVFGIRQYLGGS